MFKPTRNPVWRRPLRVALGAAALAGAAVMGSILSADHAEAGYDPNYPFCVKSAFDQVIDCSHYSWEECQFSAQGMGYCFANPFFEGAGAADVAPRGRR
jgi:hypothetical protein